MSDETWVDTPDGADYQSSYQWQQVTDQLRAEVKRLTDANERLAGMVEWLGEVIVDARDACQRAEGIEPVGSPEWVESGIAMRTTALREIRAILDRERNANPSRYDALRAEVERLRALLNPDDEALVSAILNRLNWHKTDALKHDIRTILGALRREAALGGERNE